MSLLKERVKAMQEIGRMELVGDGIDWCFWKGRSHRNRIGYFVRSAGDGGLWWIIITRAVVIIEEFNLGAIPWY